MAFVHQKVDEESLIANPTYYYTEHEIKDLLVQTDRIIENLRVPTAQKSIMSNQSLLSPYMPNCAILIEKLKNLITSTQPSDEYHPSPCSPCPTPIDETSGNNTANHSVGVCTNETLINARRLIKSVSSKLAHEDNSTYLNIKPFSKESYLNDYRCNSRNPGKSASSVGMLIERLNNINNLLEWKQDKSFRNEKKSQSVDVITSRYKSNGSKHERYIDNGVGPSENVRPSETRNKSLNRFESNMNGLGEIPNISFDRNERESRSHLLKNRFIDTPLERKAGNDYMSKYSKSKEVIGDPEEICKESGNNRSNDAPLKSVNKLSWAPFCSFDKSKKGDDKSSIGYQKSKENSFNRCAREKVTVKNTRPNEIQKSNSSHRLNDKSISRYKNAENPLQYRTTKSANLRRQTSHDAFKETKDCRNISRGNHHSDVKQPTNVALIALESVVKQLEERLVSSLSKIEGSLRVNDLDKRGDKCVAMPFRDDNTPRSPNADHHNAMNLKSRRDKTSKAMHPDFSQGTVKPSQEKSQSGVCKDCKDIFKDHFDSLMLSEDPEDLGKYLENRLEQLHSKYDIVEEHYISAKAKKYMDFQAPVPKENRSRSLRSLEDDCGDRDYKYIYSSLPVKRGNISSKHGSQYPVGDTKCDRQSHFTDMRNDNYDCSETGNLQSWHSNSSLHQRRSPFAMFRSKSAKDITTTKNEFQDFGNFCDSFKGASKGTFTECLSETYENRQGKCRNKEVVANRRRSSKVDVPFTRKSRHHKVSTNNNIIDDTKLMNGSPKENHRRADTETKRVDAECMNRYLDDCRRMLKNRGSKTKRDSSMNQFIGYGESGERENFDITGMCKRIEDFMNNLEEKGHLIQKITFPKNGGENTYRSNIDYDEFQMNPAQIQFKSFNKNWSNYADNRDDSSTIIEKRLESNDDGYYYDSVKFNDTDHRKSNAVQLYMDSSNLIDTLMSWYQKELQTDDSVCNLLNNNNNNLNNLSKSKEWIGNLSVADSAKIANNYNMKTESNNDHRKLEQTLQRLTNITNWCETQLSLQNEKKSNEMVLKSGLHGNSSSNSIGCLLSDYVSPPIQSNTNGIEEFKNMQRDRYPNSRTPNEFGSYNQELKKNRGYQIPRSEMEDPESTEPTTTTTTESQTKSNIDYYRELVNTIEQKRKILENLAEIEFYDNQKSRNKNANRASEESEESESDSSSDSASNDQTGVTNCNYITTENCERTHCHSLPDNWKKMVEQLREIQDLTKDLLHVKEEACCALDDYVEDPYVHPSNPNALAELDRELTVIRKEIEDVWKIKVDLEAKLRCVIDEKLTILLALAEEREKATKLELNETALMVELRDSLQTNEQLRTTISNLRMELTKANMLLNEEKESISRLERQIEQGNSVSLELQNRVQEISDLRDNLRAAHERSNDLNEEIDLLKKRNLHLEREMERLLRSVQEKEQLIQLSKPSLNPLMSQSYEHFCTDPRVADILHLRHSCKDYFAN